MDALGDIVGAASGVIGLGHAQILHRDALNKVRPRCNGRRCIGTNDDMVPLLVSSNLQTLELHKEAIAQAERFHNQSMVRDSWAGLLLSANCPCPLFAAGF